MTKIFISYRRQDSRAVATLIYDPLARHFEAKHGPGAVFLDVLGIPVGINFRTYLTEQVAKADLLLALIADRWLTSADEQGRRRLDLENDFVRIEIDAALKRGIPVVPLYVDDAKALREAELPESLKELAWLNGYFLKTDRNVFDAHIAQLIAGLEPHLNGAYTTAPALPTTATQEGVKAGPSIEQAQSWLRRWINGDPTTGQVPRPQIEVAAVARSAEVHPYLTAGYEDAAQRLIRTLSGHTDYVNSVALSADGRLALSGSDDRTLKLWDTRSEPGASVASGRELRTLSGHTERVRSVAFSADGRLALSGSYDKTLKLWDVASGRELRTLSGHTGDVNSVAISPDGRYLVSGSLGAHDSTTSSYKKIQIKLWVASTGIALKTWDFPDAGIFSVAFSPDGRFVLAGSGDNTAKLYDVSEWTQAK